ncbi:MAG: ATP-binding protein [Ardenticatenales bacterium]|nr:ATP-binding protein [Ardenticatenales bacterium]
MDTAQRLAQHFEGTPPFLPETPQNLEETGLHPDQISDLLLKHLYSRGTLAGLELAQEIGLPLQQVLESILSHLQKEHWIEVRGADAGGLGTTRYQYSLTDKGRSRAREVMERNGYVGVAPVSLAQYRQAVEAQAVESGSISQGIVRQALAHLVLKEQTIRQVGPAVNSGRAIFLWGAPGNGKTATADAMGRMMPGNIFIPYAIDVEGNTVVLYDPMNHERVKDVSTKLLKRFDQRWMRIKRPVIMAGGELVMENLDLSYDKTTRTHRAPFQMNANNGIFLIDDFGRQAMPPQALLNRWIMPLEKRRDFLTLVTGHQIEVPFDTLIIFSTNLDPDDLVDEAFLRRIRYKIQFPDPTPTEFREIFMRVCRTRGIPYQDEALKYLVQTYYLPDDRPFRSCQPRDLIEQLIDIARFNQTRPVLSRELLDDAASSYFVRSTKKRPS